LPEPEHILDGISFKKLFLPLEVCCLWWCGFMETSTQITFNISYFFTMHASSWANMLVMIHSSMVLVDLLAISYMSLVTWKTITYILKCRLNGGRGLGLLQHNQGFLEYTAEMSHKELFQYYFELLTVSR
jgi:hypothetical protein